MPKVAADNSPLLERAIFGYDGTNYRVVKVDADGNLVAALKSAQTIEVTQDTAADLLATVNIAAAQTIEVTQATAADLKATVDLAADQNVQARGYGYDGATWRKDAIRIGYTDIYADVVSNTSLSAGVQNIDLAAVPAGQAAIIAAVVARYDGTVPGELRFAVIIDGAEYLLGSEYGIVSQRYYAVRGSFYLGPGDFPRLVIVSATAGDAATFYGVGVLFDIAA